MCHGAYGDDQNCHNSCEAGPCGIQSTGVQDAPQGDTASDTAALLAIRAVGDNAAHAAMATWMVGSEPCDAASWSDDESGWLSVTCDGPGGRVTGMEIRSSSSRDSDDDGLWSSVRGNLQQFAQLAALRGLDLKDCQYITGDIAVLAVLPNLESINLVSTAVTGDIAALAGLLNLNNLQLRDTAVFGEPESLSGLVNLQELQLGGTNVGGPVGALRALRGLGSGWGRAAEFGENGAPGTGSCCCHSEDGLAPDCDSSEWDGGQELVLYYYIDMTPCSAYADSCEEAGLALRPNATWVAGHDQCACCVGSEIVRSNSTGLCSHCAATGEHFFGGQCVRCPQPERCVESVCVGNSAGVGCSACAPGYFAAGLACHECPGAGSEFIQFGLAVGAAVGICVVLWKVSEADIEGLTAADESEDLKNVSRAAASSLACISNSAIICSIALPSLFQITITFTLPSFPMPEVLRTLGTWAASVFSFDLGVVGSPECSMEVDAELMFKAKFALTVRASAM